MIELSINKLASMMDSGVLLKMNNVKCGLKWRIGVWRDMVRIFCLKTAIWLMLFLCLVFAQLILPSTLITYGEPPPSAFSAWTSDAPMIDGVLTPSWILLEDRYPAEWENADKGDFILSWDGTDHEASLPHHDRRTPPA